MSRDHESCRPASASFRDEAVTLSALLSGGSTGDLVTLVAQWKREPGPRDSLE